MHLLIQRETKKGYIILKIYSGYVSFGYGKFPLNGGCRD